MAQRTVKYSTVVEEESFAYPATLLKNIPQIISPSKLARTAKPTGTRKRAAPSAPSLEQFRTKAQKIQDGSLPLFLPQEASQVESQVSSSSYDPYLEAVLANCAGFYRVSSDLFVVQGWDIKRQRATVRFLAT